MMRWFKNLPVRQKVLLFLAPGMLTLVWDAFLAHWSFTKASMRWTQFIPVVYGVLAFVGLMAAAVAPMREQVRTRLTQLVGLSGMIVGGTGMYLHLARVLEAIEGEKWTFVAIGKAIKPEPPLFAPAAFAGVGLLLVLLHKITHHHAVSAVDAPLAREPRAGAAGNAR